MIILNTPIAKIEVINDQYVLKLRMSDGKYVLCNPYSNDLKGLIAALTLSIDALSGKLWLDKIENASEKHKYLETFEKENKWKKYYLD